MVSIVVPAYNAERYLPACLDSLLGQSYRDFEVVAVDDGSTDGTGALLSLYAVRDPRVRVVTQGNQGLGAARNAGMAAARGDVLMFVDSDDLLVPQALSRVVRAFEDEHPDIVVFGFAYEPADATPPVMRDHLRPRAAVIGGGSDNVRQLLFEEDARPFAWRVALAADFVRREHVRFVPGLTLGEDQAFCFNTYPLSTRTVLLPDQLYRYRVVQASMSHQDASGRDNLMRKLGLHTDALRAILDEWRRRGWRELCPRELLEWMMDLVVLDLSHLPFEDQRTVCRALVGLWRDYYGPDLLAYVPHLTARTCLRMMMRLADEDDPAAPLFGPLDVPAFYLMRRGIRECLMRACP